MIGRNLAHLRNSINTIVNGYDEFNKHETEVIIEAPIAVGQPGKTKKSLSIWSHFIDGFGDGYSVMKGKMKLGDLAKKIIDNFNAIDMVDVGNDIRTSGKNINFAILIVCIILVVQLLFTTNNHFEE